MIQSHSLEQFTTSLFTTLKQNAPRLFSHLAKKLEVEEGSRAVVVNPSSEPMALFCSALLIEGEELPSFRVRQDALTSILCNPPALAPLLRFLSRDVLVPVESQSEVLASSVGRELLRDFRRRDSLFEGDFNNVPNDEVVAETSAG